MSPYTFIILGCFIILVRDSKADFWSDFKSVLYKVSNAKSLSWSGSSSEIKFYVYNRHSFSYVDNFTYGDEEALARCRFKRTEKTIMYIHGWNEEHVYEQTMEIPDTFRNNTDHNVILTDWGSIADRMYNVYSAESVGKIVALTIKWLGKRNLINISDLHIIGFSMGAHIAGFAGRHLAPQKVRRITGLDPAGPGFENVDNQHQGLDKTDAKFVDIIHTSNDLGIIEPIGHVDFYPNGGKNQKICGRFSLKCSHAIVIDYYLSSISNPTPIVASRCDIKEKQLINCQNSTKITMGFYTSPYITGIFQMNDSVSFE